MRDLHVEARPRYRRSVRCAGAPHPGRPLRVLAHAAPSLAALCDARLLSRPTKVHESAQPLVVACAIAAAISPSASKFLTLPTALRAG